MTVVDEAEAARSSFGRWVLAAQPGPLGWCVRPTSLQDEAARLDLTVGDGSRVSASGDVLQWRLAGVDQAAAEPALPFFIEWSEPELFPGRLPAQHRSGPVEVRELVLAGDAERLERWLGPHGLPLVVRPGRPRVERVVLTARGRTLTL